MARQFSKVEGNFDDLSFSQAFQQARKSAGASSGVFSWRGKQYTTALKGDADPYATPHELRSLLASVPNSSGPGATSGTPSPTGVKTTIGSPAVTSTTDGEMVQRLTSTPQPDNSKTSTSDTAELDADIEGENKKAATTLNDAALVMQLKDVRNAIIGGTVAATGITGGIMYADYKRLMKEQAAREALAAGNVKAEAAVAEMESTPKVAPSYIEGLLGSTGTSYSQMNPAVTGRSPDKTASIFGTSVVLDAQGGIDYAKTVDRLGPVSEGGGTSAEIPTSKAIDKLVQKIQKAQERASDPPAKIERPVRAPKVATVEAAESPFVDLKARAAALGDKMPSVKRAPAMPSNTMPTVKRAPAMPSNTMPTVKRAPAMPSVKKPLLKKGLAGAAIGLTALGLLGAQSAGAESENRPMKRK